MSFYYVYICNSIGPKNLLPSAGPALFSCTAFSFLAFKFVVDIDIVLFNFLKSYMYKYNPVFFQRKMTTNSIQSIELKQNYFEQLPDEVILKVLCLLPIQDLIQCATLSRRFKVICKDFSLWKTIIKSRPFDVLLAFGQTIIQQK